MGVSVAALAILVLIAIVLAVRSAAPPLAPGPSDEGVAVARFPPASASEANLFRLAGTVRAEDGAPIAGALACDHPAFDAPTMCARSGPGGTFSLAVAAGYHKLEVLPPAGSRFTWQWYEGRDRSRDATLLDLRLRGREDLDVRLAAGRRVSGRVVGPSGGPVADAQACAGPLETPADWTCARTDADGRYAVVVVEGSYSMFFVPPEGTRLIPRWWRDGEQVLAADTLVVRGDLTGIDVDLVDGNLVFGTVTATSGKPLEHSLVCVDTRLPTGRICRPTDKRGNYSVAVRRGTFLVQFRASTLDGVVSEWHRGAPDPRVARDIVVAADVRVDGALRSGKLLWGSVRGADGIPLEGATLNAYDVDTGAFVAGGATGISGDYAFIVPVGRFRLEAYPPFGKPYLSAFFGGETQRVIEVREKDADVLADVFLLRYEER